MSESDLLQPSPPGPWTNGLGKSPETLRLVLVDDHVLFRECLRELLIQSGGFEILAEASNGSEALDACERIRPDIVIMDVGMPGLPSFEAARRIARLRPRAPRILFLSMHEDTDTLEQAFRAGASAYLVKDAATKDLIAALHAINLGHGPVVGGHFMPLPRSTDASQPSPLRQLTRREQEVLKLLAEGLSVRAIAEQLQLSMKTVDTHKLNLMRKLDLHNKAQLVHCAARNNVIQIR